MSVEERFWAKVDKSGDCWTWTAAQSGNGYGRFRLGGSLILPHRWAYESIKGPIPPGLVVDHLCRNRLCVNPEHMEVVTHRENTMRGANQVALLSGKTHCVHGHEFTESNIIWRKRKGTQLLQRECRTCKNARKERRRRQKRQEQKREEAP